MSSSVKIGLIAFIVIQTAVASALLLNVPLILASWASSAAVIAGLRGAPAARPWAVGIGHIICGVVGLLLLLMTHVEWGIDVRWLIGAGVGLAVWAMVAAKALHPPAAGNVAIPVIAVTYPTPLAFIITFAFGAILLAVMARVFEQKG
jgi:CBS-domain-containing membrane protein